jgi:P2-related tail formation protein
MLGGVGLFLTVYVGFSEAFQDDPTSQRGFFRIILTSLGGGMFFEGAFAQLQKILPERPSA